MAIDPIAAHHMDDVAAALGFSSTTFQALPGMQEIFVMGLDRNLWLERAAFGKLPVARQHVDANVQTFEALDITTVLTLGTDGNLWLNRGPFGQPVATKQHIDGDLLSFQALDTDNVFVLDAGRRLWLDKAPFGTVPPARNQIDANIRAFRSARWRTRAGGRCR